MPTASKLAAAVVFAVVAFLTLHTLIPHLPEGTQLGYAREISAAIGFAAAVFAGFAKELVDMVLERGHVADPLDILATAAPGFVLWLFTALPSA